MQRCPMVGPQMDTDLSRSRSSRPKAEPDLGTGGGTSRSKVRRWPTISASRHLDCCASRARPEASSSQLERVMIYINMPDINAIRVWLPPIDKS